ncbi:MAG: protein BatD [Bdellovibrionaceae bacterium]|nr:protein BatD [Pseudobdellovibrionaceae bacterium]
MKKIGKYLLFIIVINLYFTPSIYAKNNLSVKSQLSSKVVGIEEDFTYSLIIQSSKSISSKTELPNWPKNIEFSHSSNSEQTSVNIINGNVSTTRIKKISYTLKAKKLGWILLPSIKIVANNTTYKTKAVKIQVVKEPQARRKNSRNPFDTLNSFFDDSFPFKQKKRTFNKTDIFVKLELDKKILFLSEQVVLRWFLYTRASVSGVDLQQLPKLKSFWKKDLQSLQDRRQTSKEVTINNKIYQKHLLFSYLVSPLKLGQLNIDPLIVDLQVFNRASFGFNSSVLRRSSNVKKIKVIKLPDRPKQGTFSGAVGEFQLSDQVKTAKIEQGKAFVWEVTIQGIGNLDAFNFDNLKLDKNLELYDIQEKINFFASGISKKKIELLVIPKVAGSIALPIIRFTAFNPHTKVYYTLLSQKKNILVKKNLGYLAPKVKNSVLLSKKTKNIIEKKNDVVKKSFKTKIGKLENKNKIKTYNKYFILSFLLLLFFFLLWILYCKIKNKEKSNLLNLKSKFLEIEKNILPIDEKKAARALIDLTYWVVEKSKNKKYNFLSLNKMINELPLAYQSQYGPDLKRILMLCETIAFSKKVPVALKKQLNEISAKLYFYLQILLKYNP